MNHQTVSQLLDIAPEVQSALSQGGAVVALESTIITHGMPYPQNVATAREVEAVVRENGAVPATIAIIEVIMSIYTRTMLAIASATWNGASASVSN